MEQDCIFCKIVKNEIPCYKVYEDDFVLAFLDINPVSLGHTLVVPKEHYENIFDINSETFQKIAEVSRIISLKMIANLDGVLGVNVFQSNGKVAEQVVMHSHTHLIPRRESDSFKINSALKSLKIEDNQFKSILEKIKI